MVYYRKYRPQNISQLDLAAVREKLSSILSAKELPHAFLFTGPKGLGKTSSARILAKAINCEERQLTSDKGQLTKEGQKSVVSGQLLNIEPCNKCDACTSITNGSNIDVIEIDAASNRGIDEIRDLREKIKYAPASLPKKVYIIDEVHMLTTDAFNALLKTLEEPPSHAVFILCTTEVEKVPATIASRTFHVHFQKPSKEELIHSLERIVMGEKLDVEKGVLDQVFALSEGAFRDGAKILEELNFASKNGKITLETVELSFKTASTDTEIKKFLEALAKKDVKEAIAIIEKLSQNGADFKIVTEKTAKALHGALLARAGVGDKLLDIPTFSNQGEIQDLLARINDSFKDIRFAVIPQMPLELAVIGFCLEDKNANNEGGIKNKEDKIEPVTVRSEQKKEEKVEEQPIADRKSHIEETQEDKTKSEQQIASRTSQVENPPGEKTTSDKLNAISQPHGDMFRDNAKPEDFFRELLSRLKVDNHSIAGILRGCRLIEISNGEAIFETKFKFHKDKLNEPKTRLILDARATEILRENIKVVVNITGK